MYTVFDKAVVAAVMAVVGALNQLGFHFGVNPSVVTGVVTIITPILVYLMPNRISQDPPQGQ